MFKEIEEKIVNFLDNKPIQGFSGFQIALGKEPFESLQFVIGFLVDQKKIRVKNQKYISARSFEVTVLENKWS